MVEDALEVPSDLGSANWGICPRKSDALCIMVLGLHLGQRGHSCGPLVAKVGSRSSRCISVDLLLLQQPISYHARGRNAVFFPKDGSKGASKKGMSQTCMSNTCMSWLTSWVSTFGIVCDVVVEHFYVLVNILTATSGHCVWCCCRCTPCIRCPSHLHVSHLHALLNNQSLLHVTLHVSLTCVTYMSAYTCLPDMSFFVHVLTMSTHTSPSCMSLLHVSLNLCLLHVLVHVSPTCLSYKSPWHVSLTCLSRMFLLYVSLIHVSLKHFK